MGKSLEVIKDLGNAKAVCDRYSLDKLVGTHAIGHARMATESGVDIKSAHPFWGYPLAMYQWFITDSLQIIGTIEDN